ncbi:Uncharacterised protein [Vibrio cholerae]|nr:Uncharacterised protein [Vibrio cholerae]
MALSKLPLTSSKPLSAVNTEPTPIPVSTSR